MKFENSKLFLERNVSNIHVTTKMTTSNFLGSKGLLKSMNRYKIKSTFCVKSVEILISSSMNPRDKL